MTDASLSPGPDRIASILAGEVAKLTSKGYAVETMSPGFAVLVRRKRLGIFWNLVLTIVTGGLWLIVIAIRMFNRKAERVTIAVDATGRVSRK